jgi:lycopene beta-cyclase
VRPVPDADIAIIGSGAAGLSLARLLAEPAPGARQHTAVLIETPDARLRPPERTWCFWGRTPGELDAFTAASWPRIRVHGASGRIIESDISPLRYHMIRSSDYERQISRRLDACQSVARLAATVTDVEDHPGGALVRCTTADGGTCTVRARWVLDTRPHPLPAARTLLLQHFRGWFLRTESPAFDPGAAVLMDLRTEQPEHGLSFGYVLPFGPDDALVEYTEFSPKPLTTAQYEEALRRYTGEVLKLGSYEIEAAEQGVIPMTDGRFPRRVGRCVFRLGAAGGATRPSTGYTFAAAQRQVRAVAAALFDGRPPAPPPAHSARSAAMDAVLLRALDSGRVDGAAFFERLFTRNDTGRLLRFLDGDTTPLEDLRIGASTPVLPMLRTVAELPLLRRRTQDAGF